VIPELIGAEYKTLHIRRIYTSSPLSFYFTNDTNWGPVDAVFVQITGSDRDILINGLAPRLEVRDGVPMLFEARMTALIISAAATSEIIVGCLYRDRWGT